MHLEIGKPYQNAALVLIQARFLKINRRPKNEPRRSGFVGVFVTLLLAALFLVSQSRATSLQFHGGNDVASASIDVPEDNCTIEFWFKTTDPDCGLFSAVRDGGAGGDDRHIYLSGGNLAARLWQNQVIRTSNLRLSDGRWHHVAYVFGTLWHGQALFVDGIQEASGDKGTSDFTTQNGIFIGRSLDALHPSLTGFIDEIRISASVAPASELFSRMTTHPNLADPSLQAYWALESSADDAVDGADGVKTALTLSGPTYAFDSAIGTISGHVSSPDPNAMPVAGATVTLDWADIVTVDSLPVHSTPAVSTHVPAIQFGPFSSTDAIFAPIWPQAPSDRFGAYFDGNLWIGAAGLFTFYLGSDDGSMLSIDGVDLIDNDGLHGHTELQAETWLEPGWHRVVVRFFENYGGASVFLDWSSEGASFFDSAPLDYDFERRPLGAAFEPFTFLPPATFGLDAELWKTRLFAFPGARVTTTDIAGNFSFPDVYGRHTTYTTSASRPGLSVTPASVTTDAMDTINFTVTAPTFTTTTDLAAPVEYLGVWPPSRGGGANAVAFAGRYAYVATESGLVVVDIQNPLVPRRIGSYETENPATCVAVDNGFVYLVTGSSLIKLDVRNPGVPVRTFNYAVSAPSAIAAYGGYLYATDGVVVRIFDGTGGQVGTLTRGGSPPKDILVADGYLYVAWPQISLYQLTNPASPSFRGDTTQSVDGIGKMSVSGGRLFTVHFSRSDSFRVRVSHRDSPAALIGDSTVSSSGERYSDSGSISVDATHAFITAGDFSGRFLVILPLERLLDLDEPDFYLPPFTILEKEGSLRVVANGSGQAFITCGTGGLLFADHSGIRGQFSTDVQARSIILKGNHAYVLDPGVGFHIVDVSNPSAPTTVGRYFTYLRADSIAIQLPYAYLGVGSLAYGASIDVVDISDPAQPVRVSVIYPSFSTGGPSDGAQQGVAAISVHGNILATAPLNTPFGERGFSVGFAQINLFDVSNPRAPISLGPRFNPPFEIETDAEVRNLYLRGNNLYFADKPFGFPVGLQVVDITDHSLPKVIGFYRQETSSSISFFGDSAFFEHASGTDLIDLTFPAAPLLLGRYAERFSFFKKDFAINSDNGFKLFDLTDITHPRWIGQYPGVNGQSVSDGKHAFIASGDAMTILDMGIVRDAAPVVSATPKPVRCLIGQSVSFYANADGVVPLSYQWRFKGEPIPGATNPLLALANIQLSDAGEYSLKVSNASGEVMAPSAFLSVDIPPTVSIVDPVANQIFLDPASVTIYAEAHDADVGGSVASVKFMEGNTALGVDIASPFSLTANFGLGAHVITAIATDNEGATTQSAPVSFIVTNKLVIQLDAAEYVTSESNAAVRVRILRNSSAGEVSVHFQTFDNTAHGTIGAGIGNFYGVTNSIHFAEGEWFREVYITNISDLVFRGQKDYRVEISSPTGEWSLAEPSSAVVIITDDDAASANAFPDVNPPTIPIGPEGSLQVNFDPPAAPVYWRLAWELGWHAEGEIVAGLAEGTYPVDFLIADNFAPLPRRQVAISGPTTITVNCGAPSNPLPGSIAVRTLDAGNRPLAGQWTVDDSDSPQWLGDNALQNDLPAGIYILRFKDIPGYITPERRVVRVNSGSASLYHGNYRAAEAEVRPVNYSDIVDYESLAVSPGYPYAFSGQIFSGSEYGSGFVVNEHTVLTAGHVVFDNVRLTFLSTVWWLFERQGGEHERPAQPPAGWIVLAGYAEARHDDAVDPNLAPGEASLSSRRRDVAALYFKDDNKPGAGGYGGYLTTQSETDNWLYKPAPKMLVGYPVEGISAAARGKMHFLGPTQMAFQAAPSSSNVFTSASLKGLPGMSGGPVCVPALNSRETLSFLPAAVYVGSSSERGFARVIDLDVADIINRAEEAGAGSPNHTGGGPIYIPSGSGDFAIVHSVEVHFGPPEAIKENNPPGWRIAAADLEKVGNEFGSYSTNEVTKLTLFGDSLLFEIRESERYVSPRAFTLRAVGSYGDYLVDITLVPRISTPVVTWNNPDPIQYGTPLGNAQLNATPPVPGELTYNPAAGAVLSAGFHTLTNIFIPTDTTKYNKSTNTVRIEVIKAPSAITWSDPADIVYGAALGAGQLNAITELSGGTFAYAPSAGAILGAGLQTLSVTYTPTNPNYGVTSKSVSINITKATPIISWPVPVDIPYGTPLSSSQLNATAAPGGGRFSYTPEIGSVLLPGDRVLFLVYTPADTANYNNAIKSVTLTVNKAPSAVTWPNPADITYGAPLSATQLNAIATSPANGTLTYEPGLGAVLSAGRQRLTVTFTPLETDKYATLLRETFINVNPAPLTIRANSAEKRYGQPLPSLSASYEGFVNGDTVASLDTAVTLVCAATAQSSVGSYPIQPRDASDSNYIITYLNGTLRIDQATPTVIWSNPVPIVYGTPLSASQFNASANIPGTFICSPAIGSVLNVGENQSLTAKFLPEDPLNYTSPTINAALSVTRASLIIRADNKEKPFGASTPGFTATYLGLVNGDTPASLDASVSFTCSATAQSPIGDYSILPSGAADANYSIQFEPGVLRITTVDTDGDGLPDDYEQRNGLDPRSAADAIMDSDGDGANNRAEYLAGTNPKDPQSHLRLTLKDRTGSISRFQFSSVAARRYILESTATPENPLSWTPAGDMLTGNDAILTFNASDNGAARFYRLKLVVEP